jgi:lipid-binding SYLF domain-containing protein
VHDGNGSTMTDSRRTRQIHRWPARALVVLVAVWLPAARSTATEREEARLKACAEVLSEVLRVPEGIPAELVDRAECVIIVPSARRFALGIGASYGRGAMVCRSGRDFTGPWGPPAMYRLEGGNIGLQIGGQAADFVLLVMNPKGVESLLRSRVKLGADLAAVAGPKGRVVLAATDASMRAEILSYSRSRGLFAGVALEGSTLRQDRGANRSLYGRPLTAREIVLDGKVEVPAAGRDLVDLLRTHSPANRSDPASLSRR